MASTVYWVDLSFDYERLVCGSGLLIYVLCFLCFSILNLDLDLGFGLDLD